MVKHASVPAVVLSTYTTPVVRCVGEPRRCAPAVQSRRQHQRTEQGARAQGTRRRKRRRKRRRTTHAQRRGGMVDTGDTKRSATRHSTVSGTASSGAQQPATGPGSAGPIAMCDAWIGAWLRGADRSLTAGCTDWSLDGSAAGTPGGKLTAVVEDQVWALSAWVRGPVTTAAVATESSQP